MRKTLLSAFALAVLLGTSNFCPAQEDTAATLQPVAAVSFSGYTEVLKDVEHIGKLAGNPQLAVLVEGLLNKMTESPEGLVGLDKDKPWGFVIQTDGQQFPMYGFIPVTDLKGLLGALEGVIGPAGDAGDGVLEVEMQDRTLYVKQKGGWAFIGTSPDALADVPDDPLPMLDKLNESYDLAVRVWVKNIPPILRQMALAPLQIGIQSGLARMPEETDEQYAIRKKMTRQAMAQLTTVINELDTLLIGLAVDRESSSGYLDYEITAVEGTKTAEQISSAEDLTTDFAGLLLPDAAVTMNVTGKIAQSDVAQLMPAITTARATAMKELESQGLEAEELEAAKQMVGDLFDVVEATVEDGRLDAAMALSLDPNALTFVAGGHVADSAKLESVIKQLAAQAIKDSPEAAQAIKLDAGEHAGIRLHTLALPTSEMEQGAEMLPQLVGETLDVVIGIGDEAVYLAAGRDAMSTLKQVIDKSKAEAGAPALPMRLSVAASPIAKFVAGVSDGQVQGIAAMVVKALEQSGAKDHLTLTSTSIPRGTKVRLEMEEGLLKLIGTLPILMMGAGPGGPGEFGPPGGPGF